MIDCDEILRKLAVEGGWDDADTDQFLTQAKRLKNKLDAQKRVNASQVDIQAAADSWAKKQELAAIQRKINTERQIIARTSLLDECLTKYQGKELEGLYAKMVGSKYLREGGRDSVAARATALGGSYVAGMFTDIQTLGQAHWDIFRKGQMEREIADAMWLVHEKQNYKGPKEVMEIAEVIRKWEEKARGDANAAGAWIGKMPGYVVKQSHDRGKVYKAGYQKWRDYIEPRLDWDKISGGRYLDPAEAGSKEHFLKATWEALATGIHNAEHSAKANALVKPSIMGSEAARMSKGRILHFLSGEDWFDYNDKFRRRGGLNEAILHGLQSSAESTALMQVFGPGPQATFDAVKTALKRTLIERGDTDGAARIKAEDFARHLGNAQAEALFDMVHLTCSIQSS